MILPQPARFARIARPPDSARVPARADDIHEAVSIHIEWEVAERLEIRAVFLQVTHFMLLPRRVLVPCIAGEDIGSAVAIEIGDGAGLADTKVDGLALEWNYRAARRKTHN